jgi:hypothetical protein
MLFKLQCSELKLQCSKPDILTDKAAMLASLPPGFRPQKQLLENEKFMKLSAEQGDIQLKKFEDALSTHSPLEKWPDPLRLIADTWWTKHCTIHGTGMAAALHGFDMQSVKTKESQVTALLDAQAPPISNEILSAYMNIMDSFSENELVPIAMLPHGPHAKPWSAGRETRQRRGNQNLSNPSSDNPDPRVIEPVHQGSEEGQPNPTQDPEGVQSSSSSDRRDPPGDHSTSSNDRRAPKRAAPTRPTSARAFVHQAGHHQDPEVDIEAEVVRDHDRLLLHDPRVLNQLFPCQNTTCKLFWPASRPP